MAMFMAVFSGDGGVVARSLVMVAEGARLESGGGLGLLGWSCG